MTKVEVVNLSKRFGDIMAVDGVNLEIRDGEYLALIGPSGCGKTTLIKCIAGIQSPTSGEVYFDGILVNDLPLEERGIGYVFQEIALFPHMDVWENVTYSPRVKGWSGTRASEKAERLLELIRLGVRRHSSPKHLSGGARQKTGLARALATESDLLFLDEPLGALDLKVRAELRYEIRDLAKDLGITVIHITHDQEEAMSVSDRVAVMKAGRIVEINQSNKLYTNPGSIFVANFVGKSNFLKGKIVMVSKNKSFIDSQGFMLESMDTSKGMGEKVIASIRPECVYIKKAIGRGNSITGHVETYDFEGAHIRYEVNLKNDAIFYVREQQIQDTPKFKIGDRVALDIPLRHVLLFSYPEQGLERELALE